MSGIQKIINLIKQILALRRINVDSSFEVDGSKLLLHLIH